MAAMPKAICKTMTATEPQKKKVLVPGTKIRHQSTSIATFNGARTTE